jgi:hypothetical protein
MVTSVRMWMDYWRAAITLGGLTTCEYRWNVRSVENLLAGLSLPNRARGSSRLATRTGLLAMS